MMLTSYCPKCGYKLDSSNYCLGCGKQFSINKKAQLTVQPMILKVLMGFLFLSLIGMVFFSWANTGAQQYGLTDYNATEMQKLDISSDVNNTFSSINDIITPANGTGSGGNNPSQTDLLLFTASDLGRLLFRIPNYIGNVLSVALGFNISPIIILFALFVIIAILVAVFLQIVIGR